MTSLVWFLQGSAASLWHCRCDLAAKSLDSQAKTAAERDALSQLRNTNFRSYALKVKCLVRPDNSGRRTRADTAMAKTLITKLTTFSQTFRQKTWQYMNIGQYCRHERKKKLEDCLEWSHDDAERSQDKFEANLLQSFQVIKPSCLQVTMSRHRRRTCCHRFLY